MTLKLFLFINNNEMTYNILIEVLAIAINNLPSFDPASIK